MWFLEHEGIPLLYSHVKTPAPGPALEKTKGKEKSDDDDAVELSPEQQERKLYIEWLGALVEQGKCLYCCLRVDTGMCSVILFLFFAHTNRLKR